MAQSLTLKLSLRSPKSNRLASTTGADYLDGKSGSDIIDAPSGGDTTNGLGTVVGDLDDIVFAAPEDFLI